MFRLNLIIQPYPRLIFLKSCKGHARLTEFLQAVPDDQYTSETRFRRRLGLDTYSHYPIHARDIAAWIEGKPEGLQPGM